jgi:hypothetical protein
MFTPSTFLLHIPVLLVFSVSGAQNWNKSNAIKTTYAHSRPHEPIRISSLERGSSWSQSFFFLTSLSAPRVSHAGTIMAGWLLNNFSLLSYLFQMRLSSFHQAFYCSDYSSHFTWETRGVPLLYYLVWTRGVIFFGHGVFESGFGNDEFGHLRSVYTVLSIHAISISKVRCLPPCCCYLATPATFHYIFPEQLTITTSSTYVNVLAISSLSDPRPAEDQGQTLCRDDAKHRIEFDKLRPPCACS